MSSTPPAPPEPPADASPDHSADREALAYAEKRACMREIVRAAAARSADVLRDLAKR